MIKDDDNITILCILNIAKLLKNKIIYNLLHFFLKKNLLQNLFLSETSQFFLFSFVKARHSIN